MLCDIHCVACEVVLSELSLRWLMSLSWSDCFTWSFAVGSPLMKAVGYWLVWRDASRLAFGLCEADVGFMIEFLFDVGSVVHDGLVDELFPVRP